MNKTASVTTINVITKPENNRLLWYVYLLRCVDNSLYTGITTDLSRRLHEHNHLKSGAKYTRTRRPVELAYFEQQPNRSHASIKEYKLKKLSKVNKEALVANFTLCSFQEI